MNILVLCTGNSARSILAEALLNARGEGRITAYSAGSKPTGRVHPQALATLEAQGIRVPTARSKSWDEFEAEEAPKMDVVITVCNSAAAEECPFWPGAPLTTHWGHPDPAAAAPEDQPQAFAKVFERLDRQVAALLDQPIETLDRPALSGLLAGIGALP